jgi:hypothetical protein
MPKKGGVGYIYLIKCDDLYKIGYSTLPRLRMQKLTNESSRIIYIKLEAGHQLELVHEIFVSNMLEAETIMHKMFKHCHYEGEWFCMSDADVRRFKARHTTSFLRRLIGQDDSITVL